MVLVSVVALTMAFRVRLGLALGTGVALWWWGRSHGSLPEVIEQVLGYLSQRSYALFLTHFPVLLLVNALYVRHPGPDGMLGMVWVLVGWGLSMVGAEWLHRHVEMPISRHR